MSKQDIYGDVRAALKGAANAAVLGGSFLGAPAPRKLAGKRYVACHLAPTTPDFTWTANLIYYIPYFNDQDCTVAGMSFYEKGAGNAGFSARLGIYAEASTGGPGSLIKDVGTINCTGAAGERVGANSFVMPRGQIFISAVSGNAMITYGQNIGQADGAGRGPLGMPCNVLGAFGSFGGLPVTTGPVCDTAVQAFGALPATATVPTATIMSATALTAYVPLLHFYI